MKHSIVLLILVICSLGVAFGQTAISVQFPQVTISAAVTSGSEIVAGEFNGAAFGLQPLQAKGSGKAVVFQILDGGSDRTIHDVTVDEYFGKESDAWKVVADQSSVSAEKATTVFSIKHKGGNLTLTREIEQVSDEHYPSGKALKLRFSIESGTAMKLRLRWSGRTADSLAAKGGSFAVEGAGKPESGIPVLLATLANAQRVTAEHARKKDPWLLTATTNSVSVAKGVKTTLAEFTFSGTVLREHKKGLKQASNLESFFLLKKKAAPELVAATVPSKKTASHGDTIAYTIYYQNIGTSAGAEIEVNNPIASGMKYLAESASGEGSDITFARAKNDETSEIKKITWKFREPIYPGQERAVHFSAVVQ